MMAMEVEKECRALGAGFLAPKEEVEDEETIVFTGTYSHDNDDGASSNDPRQSSFEIEQSVPTVAELTGRLATDNVRRRRRSWLVPSLVVLVVALLAVTIGLAVGLMKAEEELEEESEAKEEEETEVSMNDKRQREDDIVQFLIQNGISSLDAMEGDVSPAYLAVTFMALQDPLQMEIPPSLRSREGYHFITRYVLCLLYYSTHGDEWTHKRHFLSELTTCDWWELNQDETTTDLYKYTGVICNAEGDIRDLLLPNAELKGSLPAELGLLKTLKTIVFNQNQLSGQIPTTLQQIVDLEHFWVSGNGLTGTLPHWIGHRFIKLKSLDVSFNRMTGSLPATLAQLQYVQLLALDNNLFSGPLDTIFNLDWNSYPHGLESLQYLYLERNQFEGPLGDNFLYRSSPSVVSWRSPLVALDVSNNDLTGTLPAHLFSNFANLRVIDANSNQLTGSFPRMEPNHALEFLALHQNLLTGEVSSHFSDMLQLKHLDLSGNAFTTWHVDLRGLTNLTYLFLADNPLEQGPVPDFLVTLTDLEELSLKSTQRTGTIPWFLGTLTKMVLLDLDDNGLTGSIPSELGYLGLLQFLLLNRNQLSGNVPAELNNLLSLRLLFLDSNELTGNGDAVLCGHDDLFVVADCGGSGATDASSSQAEIMCSCCDKCCGNDAPCNDEDFIPSNDPIWQSGYQRQSYFFGDVTYEISDSP